MTTTSGERAGALAHALSMLKVGAIGFGGGSALIPVLEKELVRRPNGQGSITEAEFVQDTVIANITPGALPPKIAALSGAQRSGARAALAGTLAVALPGAAATVGLLALFSQLGDGAVRMVEFASLGVSAFILFLLAHYCLKILAPGGRPHAPSIVIAVVAFLLSGAGKTVELGHDITETDAAWIVPELSALGLVLLALVSIAGYTAWQLLRGTHTAAPAHERESSGTSRRALRSAAVLLVVCVGAVGIAFAAAPSADTLGLFGLIAASTVASFGGGEAYVGVADGFFVASGIVSPSTFYGQIVPVANALPGPILVKIASAIGFVVGDSSASPSAGILLSLAALLLTVGIGSAIALGVLAGYDRARHSPFVRNIGAFILPVICGLLASTSVSLLAASVEMGGHAGAPPWTIVVGSLLLAAAAPVLHRRFRVPDIVMILLFGSLSLGLLWGVSSLVTH